MIERATVDDIAIVAEMAAQVWETDAAPLVEEFKDFLADEESAVFLCREGGEAVGFAQCQLRHDYVEGTETSPVGYLEGIFVKADHRQKSYGKQLLSACESWAKEQGCTEFASDCELENTTSFLFHMAAGFQEANRIICFKKAL